MGWSWPAHYWPPPKTGIGWVLALNPRNCRVWLRVLYNWWKLSKWISRRPLELERSKKQHQFNWNHGKQHQNSIQGKESCLGSQILRNRHKKRFDPTNCKLILQFDVVYTTDPRNVWAKSCISLIWWTLTWFVFFHHPSAWSFRSPWWTSYGKFPAWN